MELATLTIAEGEGPISSGVQNLSDVDTVISAVGTNPNPPNQDCFRLVGQTWERHS